MGAIRKLGEYTDDAMPLFSKTGADVHDSPAGGIWSTLTDEDVEVLADCWLDIAKRLVPVAQVVRGVVRSYSYFEVGAITGPRFVQMVRYYVRNGVALNLRVAFGA